MAAEPKLLYRLLNTTSLVRLIFLVTLWLAISAGIRPLALPDEGRYAGIAWEMVASGNWLVPRLDGLPFFHKPPLFYWITALGLSVFGAVEWAARIASIFGGIVTIGGLYLFIRRYRNSQSATLFALVLASQPFFFAGAQFANLDMLVAGMISLAVVSGADAVFRQQRGLPCHSAILRTFVLMALGVLAKGLIGIVLPAGVLFCWLLWQKSWHSLRLLFWLPGWSLFMAVGLPWFFWMQHLYPGFFDYFVIYHHFQRFAQTGFNNPMPIWFYVPVVLLGTLPWTPWIVRLFNKGYWLDAGQGSVRSLMAIWLLLILVFFSLPSSKLVGYIMPVLPPFAFFIADAISIWLEENRAGAIRWFSISFVSAVVICLALVVGVAIFGSITAKPLATTAMRSFQTTDQLVMLGKYQYDLNFYLRAAKPAWVVNDWSDTEIPKRDDWRQELFDAGKFDPLAARSVLIEPARFVERLCNHQAGTLWIWSETGIPADLPWLKEQQVAGRAGKYSVWRLDSEQIRKLPPCGGMPADGYSQRSGDSER